MIEAGADSVIIGEERYAMRLPGNVKLEEIEESVAWAHEKQAKVYVSVNKIFDNNSLEGLSDYLSKLQACNVDGVIFGDPAVLMAARTLPKPLALHWNAEMTSTNFATANYWGRQGATRVVLARELNMEQVLAFKENTELAVEVQVHGITNIYHSKRELVKNYIEHQGKDASTEDRSIERGLFLIEHERRDQRYPVYEDSNGTHIMSSEDFCMLENLPELMDGGIDSFKIEGHLKSTAYNETVVRSYRAVIDAYAANPEEFEFQQEWLDAITELQDPERELSYGFFYKEQVY
ncbi:U32 family peptidase [Paenibacillus sp. CGMCC 1.16610]|uniref:U32 family peptidase n=2 Tax=Paenibacillus TaxID=44249 RepID=A0ABW9U589_9BACL|nr:peptidase U32 family protein [Paenibacillus anseongense]MBA2939234.1 U32 family peptidase [Paenibacillus sp. CGMCC 1.16610]MVQ35193.1 U32 family peptidase [Paenibacillus anseongense]